ncbi:MAG: hypothetical protein J6U54_12520, partial [Clostridiales bacterium]|nr:hypothetical protein [Clostridiales bacterium]
SGRGYVLRDPPPRPAMIAWWMPNQVLTFFVKAKAINSFSLFNKLLICFQSKLNEKRKQTLNKSLHQKAKLNCF